MLNADEAPTSREHKEFALLAGHGLDATDEHAPNHDLDTAPLLTRDAFMIGNYHNRATQYGVFGSIVSIQYAKQRQFKTPGCTSTP
ncbi:hypothetical protein HDZ31DRAFT_70876 [Schizophyllum fasciatum]